jgi:hypothetical protein
MNLAPSRIARWIVVCIALICLVALWCQKITGARAEHDNAQVVQMAFNLERYGVISMEENPPFVPTDYREPIPVLITALGIKTIDAIVGPAPAEAYFSGDRVKYLKYQNLLWLALLCAGAFWAAEALTGSVLLGIVAVVLVDFPFTGSHWGTAIVNDLFTEIPAAPALMFACATLAVGYSRRSLGLMAIAGVLFGVVTLIKAALFYVFIGVVAVLLCFYLLQRPPIPTRNAIRELAILIVAWACVLAPWMYRNHVELGSFQLSQRSGLALWHRALEDQMTAQEYLGTFYVWAPTNSLHKLMGAALGFAPADLERGGRLQRLNSTLDSNYAADDAAAEQAGRPDQAISYYSQARAERVKLEQELGKSGHLHADLEADDVLKQRAIALTLKHPWEHLALTLPFLWRGAPLAFSILACALIVGVRRRRYDLALFALPAFGLVLFYALFTMFLGRFAIPAYFVGIVMLVVLVGTLWGSRSAVGAQQPRVAA